MALIIDIVIIAIIVLSTFLAYRKGLAALAIKLSAVIISVIVTLLLYKPISNFIINATNIDETIQNVIIEKSFETMNSNNEDIDLINLVIKQAQINALTQTARDVAIQIINICVVVILFFGLKFALKFVTVIANKVASMPIINKFNKAGGIIYGIVRGLVIIYVCLLLVSFVGKINPKNYLHENIEKSSIGKLMYENNLFDALL